jgi:hypothetical protein
VPASPLSARPKISEAQLDSWKLLGEFRRVLGTVAPRIRPQADGAGGPKRLLLEDDYLASFLFAQFNPVIDSMRGLCACSDFARVQEEVSGRHLSLGSFSEAQHVFGSERLEKVFTELLQKYPGAIAPPSGTSRTSCMQLVDSTVIAALPRMEWAEWRHQHKTQRAVRLHLKFNVLHGEPGEASITPGRICERVAFKEMVKPGEFYIGDRNYGRDYQLLNYLEDEGCGYLMRLCENAVQTVIEELPITAEDCAAGVVSDQIVRLGARGRWHHEPVRVIRIEKEELDEPLILVTNRLDPGTHCAALLAGIYHGRWKIELFFRWFKCVLGRADQWHWFAESPEGVAIQIYSALIAALLLARRIGKLPTKRVMEAIRFHAMEMVSEEELEGVISETQARKRK